MGSAKSKAKRKAELAKRARQRQQRKGVIPASDVAVNQAQVAWELKPKAFPNEPVHDIAIFARSSRDQLPEQLQTQATAVAEALELLRHGDDQRSLETLKDIPRSSPFADWRLLIRGLISFYQGDISAAEEAWSRLDPQRRPGRIAATLLKSETGSTLFPDHQGPPGKLVEAAKQLRQRPHILASARAIINVKNIQPDARFSVAQARELIQFRNNFRSHDPDFVNRFAQACVDLTTRQPDYDVFELLSGQIPGPAHDPHWTLEAFKYNLGFDDAEEEAEEAAKRYLEQDLPSTSLPEAVKSGLASMLRTIQARALQQEQIESQGPFAPLWSERIDTRKVERLLAEAVKLYPANRKAHLTLLNLLEERLDEPRTTAADRKKALARLVPAKAAFVKAFPEEVEATLWLIDQYFDEDRLPEAHKLVEQLSSYRLHDPRAKALPWKLKIREAMHHSRRKKDLDHARAALDAAQEMWPSWLSQAWLPFLQAALAIRQGDRPQFERLQADVHSAGGVSPVAADFMTFAALQQMNLPSGELKTFRESADRHVLRADSLALADLLAIGDFWWDLTRCGLRHTGYRLQASKVGKILVQRLKNNENFELDPRFEGATFWMAAHDFWATFDTTIPHWLQPHLKDSPRIAAAVVDRALRQRYTRASTIQSHIETIRQAADLETDPFYRHFMNRVLTDASERAAQWNRESEFASRDFFPGPWQQEDDEEECDCDECQAQRAARQAAAKGRGSNKTQPRPSQQSLFGIDDDDEEDDDDDQFELDEYADGDAENILEGFPAGEGNDGLAGELDLNLIKTLMGMEDGLPDALIQVLAALDQHPAALGQVMMLISVLTERLADPQVDTTRCEAIRQEARDQLQNHGVTAADADAFIELNLGLVLQVAQAHMDNDPAAPASPTAEERRRERKQRQKELNRQRKR